MRKVRMKMSPWPSKLDLEKKLWHNRYRNPIPIFQASSSSSSRSQQAGPQQGHQPPKLFNMDDNLGPTARLNPGQVHNNPKTR